MSNEVEKTWSELKAIIDNNSLYYDYEDRWFGTSPDTGERVVTVIRNAGTTYKHYQSLIADTEPSYTDSEQEEFDDDYTAGAGEKVYVYESWQFTATKNTSTSSTFKLKDIPGTSDVTGYLYKGSIATDSNALFGDSIKVEITDEDNLLGYGAGTVLGTLLKDYKFCAGQQDVHLAPPQYDWTSFKKKINTGLYLKATYTSTGATNNVEVILRAEYEY